jgi:arylsulfatase A-like enzyme
LWGFPENEPEWQEYKNKPWKAGQRTSNDAKVYAAMVAMIDRQIGEIFDLLKENNIDKNTIVFVCGDNGGQDYFKNGDPNKPKPNKPPFPGGFFGPNTDPVTGKKFRGGKRNLYEGGLRIPMVIRWPGKTQPGQISDFLWYFPDILPTLADLAHTEIPENIDGISVVPTLLGENNTRARQLKHTYLYWEFQNQVAIRIDHWKGIRLDKNKPFELYNLLHDIEEKENIANRHPDIVAKMEEYALEAHSENQKGSWFDRSKRFKGHKEQ